MFLFRGERKVTQVEDCGIVEAPLQDIVGDETRRQDGCLAWCGDGLLTIREDERSPVIAETHLAVDHREGGLLDVVHGIDRQHEFGALDAGHGPARNHPDAAGRIAVEKGENPFDEVQAGFGARRVGRQNFELGQRAERGHALVGPAQGHAAVGPGAQPVGGAQKLVGLGEEPPGGVRRRGDLRCAFKFRDADFVCAPAGAPRLCSQGLRPSREPSKHHGQQNLPNGSRE